MRTKAGNFNVQADVAIDDYTVVTLTHNDPSGVVELDYKDDLPVDLTSGMSSGRFWTSDYKGPISFRFSTFDAYATELEIEGMMGLRIDQMAPQLTRFQHNGGVFNILDPLGSGQYVRFEGLTMGGKSLPTGLIDLHVENIRSPADVDKIIEALEVNAQNNGNLFLAQQRFSKTADLLESRGWTVELEPQFIHKVERSKAPHTSVIDGKAVHHVDRRRGGAHRKQFEGRCIELNGSSEFAETDYVRASHSTATLCFWVYDLGSAAGDTWAAIGGTARGIDAAWTSDGFDVVVASDSSNYTTYQYNGGALSGWHHVAVAVSGATVSCYLDGKLVSVTEADTGTGYGGTISATERMRLGADAADTAGNHSLARIALPLYYDTALTASQIAARAAEAPNLPLASITPVPLIELLMDDATTSPIIRNTGSLGQTGDFILTGTPANIWTTCDRLSLPNEHGCSVGLVTNVDSYLDTGISLDGASAITIIKKFRAISNGAYDLDGFYNAGGSAVRIGRNTGDYDLAFNYGDASTFVTPDVAVARGEYLSLAMTSEVGGNYNVLKNGTSVSSGAATGFTAISNSRNYLIGASNDASIGNAGAHEIVGYLIADRALAVGEIEYYLTGGASGTPFDSAADPNILADYDFQTPDPHVVANLADPGNPAKIVGDCEWVAINRDAADTTKDINGKSLTFTGPVPRSAKILSPCVTLNGTSEFIQSINPVDLGGSELTASVRFRTTDADGGYLFALWDYTSSHRVFQIGMDVNGKVTVLVSHDGTISNYKQLTTAGAFNDGEWHIAEMTFDSGTMKLWVDKIEQLDAALTSVGTTTQVFSVSKKVTAGALLNGAGNLISGNIADCKLSTTAATDDQVVAGTWDADVIDWPLCEGSGNVAWDVSGNGNHGTITGSVWDGDQQDKSDVLITNGFAKGTWFDGSSDWFSRPTLVGGASRLCLSVDVCLDSLSDYFMIVSEEVDSGSQNSWWLATDASGNILFKVSVTGADQFITTTSTAPISAGATKNITVIYDGASAVIEVNGAAQATTGSTGASIFATTADFRIASRERTPSYPFAGTISQLLIHKDPTVVWSAATKAAIRAAGTTEDIAAIVENLGGTAWYFQDGSGTESLQGIATLTTNGAPEERVIPAGAGVPITYGPGVAAPGQSRVIATEPNSPFALRYAKDYQLDEGALAYEAVFGSGISHVDLGAILIGATDDFDISLDFIRTSAGSNTEASLFSQYTAATAGRMHIYVNSDNEVGVFIDGTTDITMVSGDGTVLLNRWHTVRLTRAGDVFTLYLNGLPVATQTQSGISVQQINTRLCEDDGSLDEFNGRMRNLRVDNNGTVTERLTQNIALPGATLTNVTVASENHGIIGGRQLLYNSDGTANLYETPMSAEMADIIADRKYS